MWHPTLTVAQDALGGSLHPDVAPLHNIEATQLLELVHLDYLQIEPSKGITEKYTDSDWSFNQVCPGIPFKNTDCFGNS